MKCKTSKTGPGNAERIARIWPDFVCLERRMGKEVPFILRHSGNPDPRVFDACLGTGATTIGLKLSGVSNILSNEIDAEMLRVARLEAEKNHVKLFTTSCDWRVAASSIPNMFDVVTCLGNALTMVFGHDEQLKVLRNFRELLRREGVLMIDERNYPRILGGRFYQSGEYVYCGIDKVACRLVHADPDLVVMEYEHLQTGDMGELGMYPFKRGELRGLLQEAGFGEIRTFGDYKESYRPEDVEFFTYVAQK